VQEEDVATFRGFIISGFGSWKADKLDDRYREVAIPEIPNLEKGHDVLLAQRD
jgi:hypothetical protein